VDAVQDERLAKFVVDSHVKSHPLYRDEGNPLPAFVQGTHTLTDLYIEKRKYRSTDRERDRCRSGRKSVSTSEGN
tara:strand:- start:851 stop:1075 length:225 start_codon:yes stop_codon:yes gene_type:complete